MYPNGRAVIRIVMITNATRTSAAEPTTRPAMLSRRSLTPSSVAVVDPAPSSSTLVTAGSPPCSTIWAARRIAGTV